MTWAVPDPWVFVILAAAAYRCFRLLCCDTILDRPRVRLCIWLPDTFTEWITCPWCSGFAASVGWFLAWEAWPRWTLVVAVPLALSAALALAEVNLGPDD